MYWSRVLTALVVIGVALLTIGAVVGPLVSLLAAQLRSVVVVALAFLLVLVVSVYGARTQPWLSSPYW